MQRNPYSRAVLGSKRDVSCLHYFVDYHSVSMLTDFNRARYVPIGVLDTIFFFFSSCLLYYELDRSKKERGSHFPYLISFMLSSRVIAILNLVVSCMLIHFIIDRKTQQRDYQTKLLGKRIVGIDFSYSDSVSSSRLIP